MRNVFLFLAILVAVCMCQCTNGDDIGDLYGRWKLDSFSCKSLTIYPDTVFMGFQGDAYSYQPNWTYNWGVYTKSDTTLFLHQLQYGGTFKAMYIEADSALFTIRQLENKELVLMRHDSIWSFRKILDK